MKTTVIIGGGITGLAAAWELQQQGLDYVLLEESERLGGKLRTERENGFIMEGGADSFLSVKPWASQLIREIGLGDRIIGTNDSRRTSVILHNGKLQTMPRGMRLIVPGDREGLLESPLLTDEGKRLMLAEPEVPPRMDDGDESLASFMRRRFGQEALDIFGGPLLAGIYSANPQTMSMKATYPMYLNMEKNHGSITKGTLSAPPPPPPPANASGPRTMFTSMAAGMVELVDGIREKLTGDVRIGQGAVAIDGDGTVHTSSGDSIPAGAIILAIPAAAAAKLLAESFPELSARLTGFRTTSTATVSLGYKTDELPAPLDSFGFVVSLSEPTHLQASTYNSTKLSGRAPEGYSLLRVFLGGHRDEEDVNLDDKAIVELARTELEKVLGITAEPVISRAFRWINANPQYEVGHLERVAELKGLCPNWVFLTGSPYDGIGVPDCVRNGRESAKKAGSLLVAS